MPIIRIPVENADELLNASYLGAGALISIERSATGGGAGYSVIGTTALVSGTRSYTYYDLAGAVTSWYRIRYTTSGGGSPSSYGAEFQTGDEQGGYLCSIYDVKQRLGLTTTDTSDDELLMEYIVQVSDWIRGTTGRMFVPDPLSGTRVYSFDGFDALEDGHLLMIPRGIRTISLLEVAQYTNATFNTIPATDYFLNPNPQECEPGWPYTELWMTDIPSASNTTPYFPNGYANIRITGGFGWAVTPPEIIDIATSAVVKGYQSKRTGSSDQTGADPALGQMVVSRGWLDARQWHVLQRYTLKTVQVV